MIPVEVGEKRKDPSTGVLSRREDEEGRRKGRMGRFMRTSRKLFRPVCLPLSFSLSRFTRLNKYG